MKYTETEKKQFKLLVITILVLIAGFFFAISFLPKLSIFSIPKTYNADANKIVQLNNERTFENTFEMEFDRICFLGIELDPMESNNVIKIDGTVELVDSNGNIIISKEVSSVFDTSYSFGYIKVNKGSEYTVRFIFRGSGADDSMIAPGIKINDEGYFCYRISGLRGSSDNKFVFAGMYLLISALVILFVVTSNQSKIGDSVLVDGIIIGMMFSLSILVVSQEYDLFTIGKTAFRMIESFAKGHFSDYIEESFLAELNHQSLRALFTYNYKFFIILPIAITMLPLFPFFDGDMISPYEIQTVSMYLTFVVAVLVLISAGMIKYISRECDMDKRYLINVRMLFLSSSFILFYSVAFGAVDIFYVVVILAALPFYYRKKYTVFSLFMSVAIAMKLLPLMIFIPLILLANKKIRELLVNIVIALSCTILSSLIFEKNSVYLAATNEPFIERLDGTRIGDNIAVFVVLYILVCIATFFHHPDVDNKKEMLFKSMFTIFIVYAAFTVFVEWHTQWLIPLVLSLCFLIPFFRSNQILIILSIALEGFVILSSDITGSSVYLLNGGIIKNITGQMYNGVNMMVIMRNITPMARHIIMSAICAVSIYMICYMFKNYKKENYNTFECSRPWVIGRTGSLFAFVLFYCWCFSYVG
ncbi:MAG: glycosyltransferase 87 family protein [Saccharofermentans sp.]|nr:glycosyltransferase 87 family protein [Saccharofermentans sp.]